jgi:hypothetical protein
MAKTPNERTLRVTNLLKSDSIPLSTTGPAVTKFTLSCDVYDPGERNEWALGDGSSAQHIQVEAVKFENGQEVKDENWSIRLENQGETPEWVITPQNKTELKAGESLQLKLSNIISQTRTGQANLYLRYEHISGYWDGQFIAVLEKTHLVQRDQLKTDGSYTQSSFVGIGTNDPKSNLHVAGRRRFDDNVGIGAANPQQMLTVGQSTAGGSFAQDATSGWRDGYLLYRDGDQKASIGTDSGGSKLQLFTGARTDDTTARLTIDNSGNVGIGTTNPGKKLEVAGDVQVNGDLIIGARTVGSATAVMRLPGKIIIGDWTLESRVGGSGSARSALYISYKGVDVAKGMDVARFDGNGMVPVGTIISYGGKASSFPPGWLPCDGSTFNQTQYPDLYAALGNSNTLPNMSGYFLRGLDTSGKIDPDGTDRTVLSVQQDGFASHTHLVEGVGSPEARYHAGDWLGNICQGNRTTNSTGGKETRPKNIAVLYLIFAGLPQQ